MRAVEFSSLASAGRRFEVRWEDLRSESAGYRDRGQSPYICRPSIAEQQKFARTEKIWVLLQFVDRRRGNWRGRRDKNVHFFKHFVDLAADLLQLTSLVLELGGGDVLTLADAS